MSAKAGTRPSKPSAAKPSAAPAPPMPEEAIPPQRWTRWETIGVLVAAVIAHAYYFAWRDVPVLHDAAGYLRAARDIASHGLFSKYDLSDLRTYAWPFLLSWLVRLSDVSRIPLRPLAFEFLLALHVAACLGLRRAFRMTALPPRLATLIFLAVLLNPLVLIYPIYMLTESCALSVMILVLAAAVWLVSPAGKLSLTRVAAAGSLLAGFAMMVRPDKVSLIPVWLVAVGAAFVLHRPPLSRMVATSALVLVCMTAPTVPQFANNLKYYDSPTPLIAKDFTPGARWLGTRLIKFAVAEIPRVYPPVNYDNPFHGTDDPKIKTPISWYGHNPLRGAATIGLHIFNLLDTDLPFVYNTTLLPAYYPAASIANLFVVACGFIGLILCAEPAWRDRRRVGPLYLIALTLLMSETAVHAPYPVEVRYGAPSLMLLYVFAAWMLAVRFPRVTLRRRTAILCGAGLFAAAGCFLSLWVREQAPSIRAAEQAKKDRVLVPGIVSRVLPGKPFVSGELKTWGLTNAGVGGESQAILFISGPGEMSGIFHPVILEKTTDYTVGFDARAEAGLTAELSVDLYAGASYDQTEQNSLFDSIGRAWTHYSAQWNSGGNAPQAAYLRFFTVSTNPIEIRNITFARTAH